MRIRKISKITHDEPIQYYDVVNANPYNNFLVKTQTGYVVSHNCMFDEISFIRNQDIDKQKAIAIDMVDTAIGGMKTRYIKNGKNPTLLCLASSKRSEKSFLEEHMKQKLKSEKENVLIVDEAVWDVKPKGTYSNKKFRIALGNKFLQSLVIEEDEPDEAYISKGYKIIKAPIDFLSNFLDDIDRALCDYAGISSTEISKYISGVALQEVITDKIQNPFTKDIIEVGNASDDTAQYYDFFDFSKVDRSQMHKPLFIHLDMSVSGDMTGIAGIWIKGKKTSVNELDQSKDLFFSLAFSVSIKAPKGRQISFEKNRNFIYWLKEQGFNIKGISTDSFQSTDTGQALLARKYPYEVISVDRVDTDRICKPYQYFKSTIYEKRLEIYNSKELVSEIIDLERNINTGRVDHPDGGKKDITDAVCASIYNASKHAEEFAYDYGEDYETTFDVNSELNEASQKQQINIDFEEELKRSFMGLNLQNNPNIQKERTYDYAPTIIDSGVLVW